MVRERGKRTRIAEGIFSDSIGVSAIVKVGKRQREKRFTRGTPMQEIRDWQTKTRALLVKKRALVPNGPLAKGTFAADVDRFLPTLRSRPSFGSARACLNFWSEHVGSRRRATITLVEYQTILDAAYRCEENPDGRYAGSMCNHCKDWLVELYRTLDQCEDEDNLATKLRRYPQADAQPRAIPEVIVDEIFAAIKPSKARACLKVLAYVGIPPARLRRLQPTNLDLKHRTVFLTRRRKGKGTEEKTFPLSAKGVAAFQEFLDQNAWGGVVKESLYTVFFRGITAANRIRAAHQQPLIPPFRPYDLRHTFGAQIYRKTGDLGAAAELLDVTLETAKRYTLSAVPDRLAKTIEILDAETPTPSPSQQPEKTPARHLKIVSAKRG